METQMLQVSVPNTDMLRFGGMLRGRNPVSHFEYDVAQALLKAGLLCESEPYRFFVEFDGKVTTFTPDLRVTNAKMGGKEIILEPHGAKYTDDFDFKKLNAFMKSGNHDGRYFVFITDMDKDRLIKNLRRLGMKPEDIADDIWFETNSGRGTDGSNSKFLEAKARELADRARAESGFIRHNRVHTAH